MPMQTTPAMRMIAKPLESCDDGEVCTGGSSCDEDTGMCMCPPGQVAFGEQCRHPPTAAATTTTPAPTRPAPVIITTPAGSESSFLLESAPFPARAECSNDAHCTPGKTCIAGKCRCKPGTMDNGGVCEPIEGSLGGFSKNLDKIKLVSNFDATVIFCCHLVLKNLKKLNQTCL